MALAFINSVEFINNYGANISNEQFVTNLYENVLGRSPDLAGLNYWSQQLNNGIESRNDVLIGFSESAENKALFTEMTGFG